jgi:RimJ/RimL family protein N-acetyltransferase
MAGYLNDLVTNAGKADALAFAQIRTSDNQPVGVTRFVRFRPHQSAAPYAVEIGGTWLAASAQRTGINVEAKLLLLGHAFDTWRVRRVDFTTDARNERSRTAIAALGATFEGVLHNWGPSHVAGEDDQLRDTAIYSVLDTDWPEVVRTLRARLRRTTA